MVEVKPLKNGRVRVGFTLPAELGVKSIAVGDFNGWNPEALPMKRRKDGWKASAELEAGRDYQFLYLTDDGTFLTDEHCACCPNPYGGENSLLRLVEA